MPNKQERVLFINNIESGTKTKGSIETIEPMEKQEIIEIEFLKNNI